MLCARFLLRNLDHLVLSLPHLEVCGLVVKGLPAMQESQETQLPSLDWEEPLKEGIAIHSSSLAWRIPWTEEPGRLQPIGSQRVGHN